MGRVSRRDALKISGRVGAAAVGLALAECAAGQEPPRAAQLRRKRIDEFDPTNTKVGHIVSAAARDDDVRFLQQIGIRSILVNFKPGEATLDEMRRVQERFARHNIQIFGYLDMYQVMKSLREVGFTGCAVPDHIPQLVGDNELQRSRPAQRPGGARQARPSRRDQALGNGRAARDRDQRTRESRPAR